MNDILLNRNGDLYINENGDISLTTSVVQAVKIHLRWFFEEWKFSPQFGIPWFDEVTIKNPDTERIRRIIRDEIEKVESVVEARDVKVIVDKLTRKANISFKILTTQDAFKEEVIINV